MAMFDFLKTTKPQGAAIGVALDKLAQMFGRPAGAGTSIGQGLLQGYAQQNMKNVGNVKLGGADRQQPSKLNNTFGLTSFEYGMMSPQQQASLQRQRELEAQRKFEQNLALKKLTQNEQLAKMSNATAVRGQNMRARTSKYGTDVGAKIANNRLGIDKERLALTREEILNDANYRENELNYRYEALGHKKDMDKIRMDETIRKRALANQSKPTDHSLKVSDYIAIQKQYASGVDPMQQMELTHRLNLATDVTSNTFRHPITGKQVVLGLDTDGSQITWGDIQEAAMKQHNSTEPTAIVSIINTLDDKQRTMSDTNMIMYDGIDDNNPEVDLW